jgi:ABC-type uncharacterized transport system ATPase subunit
MPSAWSATCRCGRTRCSNVTRRPPFRAAAWCAVRRARAHARRLVQRFDVRGTEGGGPGHRHTRLSGGNMQKLILGRALAGDPACTRGPPLIVANQPTWGLDIGAVAYVHQQLLDAAPPAPRCC